MTYETKVVWHDLIEDPNDLPESEQGTYMITYYDSLYNMYTLVNDCMLKKEYETKDGPKPAWIEHDPEYYEIVYPYDFAKAIIVTAWAENVKPYVHHE